ncbi:MAG TPA: RDD family protein [Terriglobales bacterium]|nr:RDD family protein [Terriglobales bacterium]
MICPQCHQERTRCRCASPAQARLLAPPPAWKRELQERVEAYRLRHHGAPPRERESRVLEFRGASSGPLPAAAAATPAPIHSQTVAVEEPLAEPVLPPRPAPAPPRPQASPAVLPARPVRDPWLPRRDSRDDACLQLPLPMASTAAATAARPLASTPAPPRLRLRAALTDAGIVLAAALVFAVTTWATLGFPALQVNGIKPWMPALVGVPAVLAAAYLLLCAYGGGPTLGMRRWGLEVASLNGPLTPAVWRHRGWACLLSLAPLGMGFIWMFCDRQGLGWHDTLSRTCVVEARNTPS